jgi:TRAP-type C4-dicarboxylate transport system permease small subunit
MTKDEQNNLLDAVAGIFLRCFVLAVCLLLFSFVFYLLAADWAYSIHSRWFDISRLHFDLMYYYVMAFMKIASFLFFLLPFISIKLFLRKKKFTP